MLQQMVTLIQKPEIANIIYEDVVGNLKPVVCKPWQGKMLKPESRGLTTNVDATFFCDCDNDYLGVFCEEFNACQNNPCQNNGTCMDMAEKHIGKNFSCTCLPGYTGGMCQSEIDYCIQQPCKNGGTCYSSSSGFNCQCPEGFLGPTCADRVDYCASFPCQNNGTCYTDRLSYSCSCSSGFTGPTCAHLIDFCALNPCAHGICRSVGTSYKCLCIPGM
ncbi:PREDICTED: delta and Notch-like epidermal growth factor-related receptor [Thamnophis sirtalis]|uniref:Delta and Notch-like epidermal growth factor-related receptor n=1 Tax=Thamnophis sirtalis TaxID=35019 RepID=A0A6I9XU21_9SAUR|nr:PREDICTED: delta and Notch-like epidermal growth factor-related receptor [Thamnophis sirtalis]